MQKETTSIVMSNNFVEAHYRASLIEKKLMLLGILKFNKDAEEQVEEGKIYKVVATSEELMEYLGLSVHDDYANIKSGCKKLGRKVIEMKSLGRGKGFKMFTLVTDAELENGLLTLGFHWQIFPYFKQLRERFTKCDLLVLKEFTSIYTIRFYELIKQYESVGNRIITIGEFNNMFNLKGKHKLYGHFKESIINTAHKELKAKSDIYFEYRELKESRKVVAIELQIKYKNGKRPKPSKPASSEAKPEVSAVPPSASAHSNDTYSPLAIELLRMFKDWHGNPDRFIESIGDEGLIRDVMKRFPTTDKWGMVSEVAFFRGMVKDALIRKRADITRNIQGVRREYTQELFERREHYKKLNRDFKDDMIRFSEGRASSYEEQYLKSHYTYRQIDSLQIGEELIVLDDFLAWMEIY